MIFNFSRATYIPDYHIYIAGSRKYNDILMMRMATYQNGIWGDFYEAGYHWEGNVTIVIPYTSSVSHIGRLLLQLIDRKYITDFGKELRDLQVAREKFLEEKFGDDNRVGAPDGLTAAPTSKIFKGEYTHLIVEDGGNSIINIIQNSDYNTPNYMPNQPPVLRQVPLKITADELGRVIKDVLNELGHITDGGQNG